MAATPSPSICGLTSSQCGDLKGPTGGFYPNVKTNHAPAGCFTDLDKNYYFNTGHSNCDKTRTDRTNIRNVGEITDINKISTINLSGTCKTNPSITPNYISKPSNMNKQDFFKSYFTNCLNDNECKGIQLSDSGSKLSLIYNDINGVTPSSTTQCIKKKKIKYIENTHNIL